MGQMSRIRDELKQNKTIIDYVIHQYLYAKHQIRADTDFFCIDFKVVFS